MFSDKQVEMLNAKLSPSNVKPAKQYGPKGDYIEGWHAIAEANRIFGFGAWSYSIKRMDCVAQGVRLIGKDKKEGHGVSYIAHVSVDVCGVFREDVGSGHGYDMDLGLAHESAIKEAVTDALKRALRSFGNPFGLALYDKTRENVGDDPPPPKPEVIIADELPFLPEADESQALAIEMLLAALVTHKTYNSLATWWKSNQANIKASLPSDYYEAEVVERQIKPRLAKYKAAA